MHIRRADCGNILRGRRLGVRRPISTRRAWPCASRTCRAPFHAREKHGHYVTSAGRTKSATRSRLCHRVRDELLGRPSRNVGLLGFARLPDRRAGRDDPAVQTGQLQGGRRQARINIGIGADLCSFTDGLTAVPSFTITWQRDNVANWVLIFGGSAKKTRGAGADACSRPGCSHGGRVARNRLVSNWWRGGQPRRQYPAVADDGTRDRGRRHPRVRRNAGVLANGKLHVPIAGTYPLERIGEAYAESRAGHVRGKLVLVP